jgi:penicillin-insensitive murein endopeptidase
MAMRLRGFVVIALIGLALPAAAKKTRRKTIKSPKWHAVKAPNQATAEAIGSYAGGCLSGAVAVPKKGVGYETIRRWRNRFWAHPTLARFLDDFGAAMRAAKLPDLLIGDLSQPRGGRMKSGHRSHQIGLDADIWFERPKKRSKDADFASLVHRKSETINRAVFKPRHVQVLKMAAQRPEVARIFVNWVIKRELCATVDSDRAWLRKIRPWYGHDRHYHVRLHCPADSPGCRAQSPVPTEDDCGTETWFSRAEVRARRAAAKAGKSGKPGPARRRKPRSKDHKAPCARILTAP